MASPTEQRFYLDELSRGLDRGGSILDDKIPAYTWVQGILGSALILLSVVELVREGLDAELFVYTNVFLGLTFLKMARDRNKPGSRFAPPYLALDAEGVTIAQQGETQRFTWTDLAGLDVRPSGFVFRPHDGEPVTIGFSDLPYQRVQEMKAALADATRRHGVPASA